MAADNTSGSGKVKVKVKAKAKRTSGSSPAAKRIKKESATVTTNATTTGVAKQQASDGLLLRLPTLILDTGGSTIKHGVAAAADHKQEYCGCRETPNATAKLRHQLTVLTGDEMYAVKNQAQLEVTRPLERGYMADLGTQLQPFTPKVLVDRVDELLFGELGFRRVGRILGTCASALRYIRSKTITFYTPPTSALDAIAIAQRPNDDDDDATTTPEEENIGHDANGIPPNSAWKNDLTQCCCVVDSGFSSTHIVPTYNGASLEKAIRRVNVGGKLLTNLLKESVSYRQWNMMDEFHIVNEAKEKLCFVSTEFTNDMDRARTSRVGHCWFDREFLLPDFVNTFEGTIRLPPGLLRDQHLKDMQEKKAAAEAEAETETGADTCETQGADDNNDNGSGVGDDDTGKDDKDDDNNDSDDDANHPMEEDDEDSDNETDTQRRKRILRQKDEEQRRRDMEEQERQALSLSVERFAIPEVLFCPSDIGLIQQVGMAQAIVQAIDACDAQYRAAMYHNILVTGGNAKLPFFQSRLEKELRSLAPNNYPIRVIIPEDPVRYAWQGANQECVMADQESNKDSLGLLSGLPVVSVQDCFVEKHDWEANKKKKGSKDHTSPDVWDIIRGKHCKEGFTMM
eukprot:scaffold71842_cov46-Attheya_sp.AAC.2